MKSLLLLHCFLFFIGYSLADNDGNCQIQDIDDNDFMTAYTINIDDTQIDTNVLEKPFTGTLEVKTVTEDSNSSYFVVTTDGSNFVIQTTEEFQNFDKNIPKQTGTNYLVTVDCTLQCDSGTSSLVIRIFVNDINSHPPAFQLDSYEFKVPSPIMPLTDFSIYGDATIIATDIDFSNQNIEFKIEPDDFSITTLTTATSKDYTAVFAARRVLQLTEDTTYTITATDSGTSPGPLSASTTITLVLDEANSLELPVFEKSSYGFNYTIEDSTPDVIELDGHVTITTNKASSLTYDLSGEYSDYFEVSFDTSTSTFGFSAKTLLPTSVESFVLLILSATTDNTAVTTLVVHLPTTSNETPQFSNPYYTGSYDDVTETVTLDSTIEVTSTSTPTVNISGEYAEHFAVKYDEKTKSCQISVKTNLSTAEIKAKSYTTLELEASIGDAYATATIILSLPQHTLQFTKVLYTATYKNDSLTNSPSIGFKTESKGVKIELSGTYKEYFGIKYDSTKTQWNLVVSKPLTNDIFKSEHEIVITLTATDDYEDQAQSVVAIELPVVTADAPKFSEVYYLADYTDDGTPTVTVNKDITITNVNDESKVKITLDSYTNYFGISYDKTTQTWVFKSLSSLTNDILRSEKELVITLTAEEDGNSNKGESTVVINWITIEAMKFSQPHYTGNYPESGTGTIEIDPDISFKNVDDQKNVAISLDSYTDNFDVSYKSNKWTVTIKKKLDDSTLSGNGDLVITLSAKDSTTNDEDKSILIITLPTAKEAPEFSEIYYIGTYPESGTGTMELDSDIEFSNVDDQGKVTISLDTYSDNFDITLNADKWTVAVKKALDDTVLAKSEELVITLTATETDNENKGQSVLVIELPGDKNPTFSEAHYLGDYPKSGTGTIELDKPIAFLNVDTPTDIKISLDKYTNNFEFKYDNDKWTLNIKSSLGDTVLNENDELIITLTATKTGSTTEALATLLLKLPAQPTAPKFSEAYYLAQYPATGKGSIEIEKPISFQNVDDPKDVSISLDSYQTYFKMSYTAEKWTIEIIQSLEDSILNQNTELVMTLLASESGIDEKGESVLVLNLPAAQEAIAPKFSEAYYVGEYPESGTGTIVLESDIELTNVDPTKVTIALNNYASNFKIEYTSNKWILTIQSPLDSNVLYSNAELITALIATEEGNDYKGNAALILKLPTSVTGTAPKFSNAFYVVDYPQSGSGVIEFGTPLTFTNVVDLTSIKIKLDSYVDNFEIKYATDTWYINIKEGLDKSVLNKNTELVATMIATESGNDEEGEATLVIKLPTINKATAPHFADSYYIAEYPEGSVDVIQFKNPVTFTNVDDITKVAISLDTYADNFGITYNDGKWQINVKKALDTKTLRQNAELVISLIAIETGNTEEGLSALVLRLPSAANGTAPKFSEPYYFAEYPESGTGTVDFEGSIEFINVEDLTKLTLSLDQYTDNFEISYNSKKWQLKIKTALTSDILYHNTELVMSLTANEEGNQDVGYSALVLKLPTATKATAPIFSEAYYTAEYPESGSGTITFDNAVSFKNVEDPAKIKLAVEKYQNNFEITYEKNTWSINIKQGLSDTILHNNVELVMTLVATETDESGQGLAALILKLPSSTIGTAPKFSDAYYIAEYPEDNTAVIEFDTPVQFANVDDPSDITISLDKYADNFEVVYHSDRWYINTKQRLEDTVLHENVELVITLIATSSKTKEVGDATLVLKLPTAKVGTAPRFSKAYYLAKYPKTNNGTIEFETAVEFSNVDDITKITIATDSYAENFEIAYASEKWYINIAKSLEEAVLQKNVELVITLIATESGSEEEGRAALVLELPSQEDATTVEFSEAYYLAQYPANGSDIIDFETPIKFKNVDDSKLVEITLSKYSSNFEVVYDGKAWYIKVVKALDESVIIANTELVMTLTAHKTDDDTKGYSVLVLNLPSPTEAPKFSEAYYLAEYPESGEGNIEFKNPVTFSNVDNPTDVQIKLDNYLDNFAIVYSSDRWYIEIKKGLEESVLGKNVELVMTMIATETGHQVEGDATLILRLPKASVAPEFSDAYYVAEYTENESGVIEFQNPITFSNIEDPTTIEISLDNYAENFKVTYSSKRWYLKVNNKLEKKILNANAELVMTLTAVESSNNNEGYAALVLKLPAGAKATAPEFEKPYYIAEYPESGDGDIEFNNAIKFLNVEDPKSVSITVDTYSDNFDIKYESDKWSIKIKKTLDSEILSRNVELVMTLTAVETDNENKGYSALILKLPTASLATGIKFSKTYYTAEYPETGKGTVDISDAIEFYNVDDIKTVTVSLDTYQDYFTITYESKKWVLNVVKNLDSDVLVKNTELVMTLIASNSADKSEAHSALVLNLPTEIGPIFSDAYYTAEYPEDVKDVIALENEITFKNVDDVKKVNIELDNYTDYFDIKLVSNKWCIQVKKHLDESILDENLELVATLTATEENKEVKGYAALVIKLPTTSANQAPEFSKTVYVASYQSDNDTSSIILTDDIVITNKEDMSKIEITVDNYQEYINVAYNSSEKAWIVTVLKNIPDETLNSRTDLVIALTATDTTNKLAGHSVIDLTLPSLDAKTAPEFSQAYYTGKYEFSNNNPVVTLDTPLDITNKDDLTDVSISLDNYADNFKIEYITASKQWKVEVIKKLDEVILNSKVDLLMTLTATDSSNKESGQCALVLTLPVVNTDEAPKFSSIYYSGKYKSDDGGTVTLDDSIKIINKEDLTKVKISFDDSYKNNFDIQFDTASSQWVLKVKTPLEDAILNKNVEITLTLTATETDNSAIGQSVLVLDLPVEQTSLPPKFSLPHYSAKYSVEDDKASVSLEDTITVVNKKTLTDISVTLDSYQTNFKLTYDSTKQLWALDVGENLSKDILESQTELILTLTATEDGNDNTGESTLIVALPSGSSDDEVVKFSQVHYAASYITGKNDKVEVDDTIQVEYKGDVKNVVVSFENEDYAKYFQIALESDTYVVNVLETLPSTILGTQVSLPLTIVAAVDDSKAYATLVINLPTATAGNSSISFTKPLYDATYSVSEDGTVTFQVQSVIEVKTDPADADVETSITSTTGYEQYFGISYSKNILSILKTKNIPETVLKTTNFIPLIITVGIKGTTDAASSVLNVAIDFSGNEDKSLISFSNVLYNGKYEVTDGKGTLTVNDVITVTTDEADNDVEATIANEYNAYFKALYSNKIVTLDLAQQIPGDILNSTSVIPVIVQLSVKDSDQSASAVVNILVVYDEEEDPDSIKFSTVLYTAHYSVKDGKGQLSPDEDIIVITDAEDSQIKPTIEDSDYVKYFSIGYASKSVSVTLKSDIPDDILKNTAIIPLVLTVEIIGTTQKYSAVLNIIVDDNEETNYLEFSKPLYNGEYIVTDGKINFTVDDKIELSTNEDDNNIEVVVSNEYDGYIEASYSSKVVTISLKEPFSDGILNTSSVVPIVLQAGIKGSENHVSAVLNIKITYDHQEDPQLIEFGTYLYSGKLTLSDGKEELTLDQDIKVITDAKDTEIEASIYEDTDFTEYFSVTYSEKTVSVSLKTDIPEDILATTSFIPLSLVVKITGTSISSHCILNVAIINNEEEKYVKFSELIYDGKYKVTDGTGVLTTDDDIEVDTNESDDNIEVIVSNEYNGYIQASYSNKVVTISLKKQLSSDILNSTTFISVQLQVTTKDNKHQASAVLNIAITYKQEDPILIEFSVLRYIGEYSTSNGKGELEIDEDIKVITDANDNQVAVGFSDGSDYSKYFEVTYERKGIKVKLVDDIPEDVLKVTSLISLIISAEITGTTYRSSAVLDILITNAEVETKAVAFSDVLYHGKYNVTDGKGVLTLDDQININTSENDNKIIVVVSNEYDGYILASYSKNIVTISLKKQFSTEILNSTSVVPVTLKASVTATSYEASAVLNIIIIYNGETDTSVLEFSKILYYGNYSIYDYQGRLLLDDIKLITDKNDTDIEVGVSEDSLYKNLFETSYSNHIVSVTLKDNLPEGFVKDNSLLALTLEADIKGTTHTASAVLNVQIDQSNNNDNNNCEVTNSDTAYIAVISVLCILLIVLIAAVVAFYFLRIRKKNYSNLEEEDGRVRFNKHSLKRSSTDAKPASALDERRPTGFVFNPISEDSIDGTDSIGEPEKTRRKSVAFDDNVEKLTLEPTVEDDNVSEDDNNSNRPDVTRV